MIEMPVLLIQALHERQQCLQGELQTIQALRTQEVTLKAELGMVEALLSTYPVSHGVATTDEPPPPEETPTTAPTLADCIDALLAAHGPLRLSKLNWLLRQVYAVEIADGALGDLLQRGFTEGRYARSKQIWRLAVRRKEETP